MHTQIQIPNKSQFKANEVSSLTSVKPYVLRFWESEFDQIDPMISSSGQKLYEHKDIEVIAFVKKLLFDDKMTIEEAKREVDLHFHYDNDSHARAHNESLVEDVQKTPALSVERFEQSTFRKSLSDSEIQKLVLAKAKLNSIIMKTSELAEKYSWS